MDMIGLAGLKEQVLEKVGHIKVLIGVKAASHGE